MNGSVVIAGVGETAFEVPADGRSAEALTIESVSRAASDAGLSVSDIDGICKYSYDGSVSDMDLVRTLGLRDLRFSIEVPHGGGSCASVLQAASAAVLTGIASHVVCYRTVCAHQWFRQMATPDRARPYYFDAKRYLRPSGLKSYLDLFALLFQEHMARFGTERRHLGALAVAARAQAQRHDNAVLTEPLSMDDYLAAQVVTGSLSELDNLVQVDGSVAVIVTSVERARDLDAKAVPILAVAESGDADRGGYWELVSLRPDPLTTAVTGIAARLYGAVGIDPGDIDVSLLYDCSTYTELQLLEEYGLVPRGEPDAVLEPGFGESIVPINPHGGHLAGGYVHGFSQVAEAVRQMRGEAANQVVDAELALVGGPPSSHTSGAILGKATA